jgi:hypothetical protein
MEKKPVLYPYRRSAPAGPVQVPHANGLKKGPHVAEKDSVHSAFLAERGCLGSSKTHKHNAA